MKPYSKISIFIGILVLALSTLACGLFELTTAPTATPVVVQAPDDQPQPAQTSEPTQTAAPVETATETQPEPDPSSSYTGFVVYLTDEKEFQIIGLDGSIQTRIPAPGFDAYSHNQVDVVGGNVYYYSSIDKQIYRANASSLVALVDQPAVEPFGFKISADEKQIAWSVAKFNDNPVGSELWVGNLDGSNARKVAEANVDQLPAFLFIPLEWTADGKVLYNLSQTGFGGYILYGGSNSLYSYDPASQQAVSYVPANELHGLCLDSYRLDLNKVAFNCGPSGSEVVIRDLATMDEKHIPPYSGYLLAGSIRFSPNGEQLAYATAKGDPEAEEGKLMLLNTDLNGEPIAITSINNGYFYVESWIDADTLLVTRNDRMAATTIFKINRDGSDEQPLATGWFVAMTP